MSVAVTLNGQPRELAEGTSVEALLKSLAAPGSGRGVAVALDGEVVPRGLWASTRPGDGSRIEIVAAVQGG